MSTRGRLTSPVVLVASVLELLHEGEDGHNRDGDDDALYTARACDTALLREATEINVKAERVAGQMLIAMGETGGRDKGHGGDRRSQSPTVTVKLADLSITKMQSSRWQRLARLDEQAFAQKLDRTVRKAIAAASGAGN